MKNSNDTIGNQTRDLLACSAVPKPTAPPRAPPPLSTVPGQYFTTYSTLHQSFLDRCMVVTKPVDSSQVTFTKFHLGLEFWISTLVLTTSQDSVTVLHCMYIMFSLNSVCFMVQHNAGYFMRRVLCCFHCGSWAVNQFCWFNMYKTRWAWQWEKVLHCVVINLYFISSFHVLLHPE